MEEIIHCCQASVSEDIAKVLDELLNFIQIQFSCMNSLDKVLEIVIDHGLQSTTGQKRHYFKAVSISFA